MQAGEEDAAQFDDSAAAAAVTIQAQVTEYLRLQPHERDNFSILLYNCDSPELTTAVVNCVNKVNDTREDSKITCQVLLMHRDEEHLRHIYRDLVARGMDVETDTTEASGEFLARVRVSITAATSLQRQGRSQPVDIVYCRDLVSKEARMGWEVVKRVEIPAADLQTQQWSRRLPVNEGDRRVRLQLTCPAQSPVAWVYIHALASLCTPGIADDAWKAGKCPVLMRCLDFDDSKVARIFNETHDLANWVVNQDELLDRKLLEAQRVKVIRYVQSATQGRNLIISSAARDTLIVNTLKEKLAAMLPSSTSPEVIERLKQRCLDDASRISGGLVLKAARRANNTNELLGMVLSRYLVLSELGDNRTLAWCFLDDYSQWLGKKEGANIADLLVLAPKENTDGSLHLDVVVTEAKFVTYEAMSGAALMSEKQLVDTLSQISEALSGTTSTCDQSIWLARLSDLLVAQAMTPQGLPPLDSLRWQHAIRNRACTVSVWGYSHIFVYGPNDLTTAVSMVRGIHALQGKPSTQGMQEVFGPDLVRALLLQYDGSQHPQTKAMRVLNGHTHLDQFRISKVTAPEVRSLPEPVTPIAVTTSPIPPAPAKQPAPLKQPPVEYSSSARQASVPEPKISAADSTPLTQSTVSVVSLPAAGLLAYLEGRSLSFQISEDEGKAWLADVTLKLRQALVSRNLPAKLVDGMPPILTPNAGIIKLQGSIHLTVQAVEAKADEIYTSEGLKIISTRPESGRISIAVERPNRQTLHTEPILLNFLRQAATQDMGEKILVGLREEDSSPMFLDPFNLPHTLVAGTTGSGKSVLIQNLILCIAASRTPEQAHIFLIDPKYGVDYRPLDELPHIQLGSGGVIDDPAAAIRVLNEAVTEMERRYQLFKTSGAKDIQAYRLKTGIPLPTLWIIHDEFADWMQTDVYRDQVPELVNRLGIKARGAGIFLIFAAQRPDKDVMPMQLRAQLGNRLILRVDNAGTSEIAMGEKYAGAERLLGKGHMLAKTGATPDPVLVQVPYIDERTFPELVRLISGGHSTASPVSAAPKQTSLSPNNLPSAPCGPVDAANDINGPQTAEAVQPTLTPPIFTSGRFRVIRRSLTYACAGRLPVKRLIATTQAFTCEVRIDTENTIVDGKDGVGLIMLILSPGQKLTVEFRGVDAPQAAAALEPLLVQMEKGQLEPR